MAALHAYQLNTVLPDSAFKRALVSLVDFLGYSKRLAANVYAQEVLGAASPETIAKNVLDRLSDCVFEEAS